MKSREAALLSFDPVADATRIDEAAADDLFAVVDLLDGQPPLRRSLSDPSASPGNRQVLARRLFDNRLGAAALAVLLEVVGTPWPSGRAMVDAIERQGLRGLLRPAIDRGELKRIQEELYRFAQVIESSPELSDALRDPVRSLDARKALISRLLAGKAAALTQRLALRAAAARARTVSLTLASYLVLAAALAGERIAQVTVARPLDEAREERLRRALEARVGGPVSLQIEVDEKVLGGMSITLGEHIFESTVAGRLDEARRLLN